MSQETLDQAYQFIKQGRYQAAIEVLEPIIQQDGDNADAWWLLANATDDTNAKMQALREVLRIGTHAEREDKAREMLAILREEAQFSATTTAMATDTPTTVEPTYTPPPKKESSSCKSRRKFPKIMAIIGGVLLFTCFACFGIIATVGNFAGDFAAGVVESLEFVTLPDDFRARGALTLGETVTGEVQDADDRIGYTYTTGDDDERLFIEITTDENIVPLVFIYDEDGDIFDGTDMEINGRDDVNRESRGTVVVELNDNETYTFIVRPIFGFGTSTYEMTVTQR